MKTPIINLRENILVKLENFNPTGSHKYRAAKFVVRQAIQAGYIEPFGKTRIIEKSGGNFGVGLAYEAGKHNIGVDLVIGLSFSPIKRALCEQFGASIIGLDDLEEGLQPREIILKFLEKNPDKYFFSDQFNNQSNLDAHYSETGLEIVDQLREMNLHDKEMILVKGAGTGASITGISRRLRENFKSVKIFLVYPLGCDVVNKKFCSHIMEGTMVGIYPPFLDLSIVDDLIPVSERQAIEGQRTLARATGIYPGISSGANIYAACLLAQKNKNAMIITASYDFGEGYLLRQVLTGRSSILSAYKQASVRKH